MEIRMSLANTRTPRKRSRRRKHSYRRMGTREDARITDTMNEFTWFMGRRYKLVDAADHIGYEWTGRAHGSLADALATLAVQRWLEQWLVAG